MPYKDKQKQKEYLKEWRIQHKTQYIDYQREYHKEYHWENREIKRQRSKSFYKNHKYYLRDKQRAKLGTTDFKSHRLKDFREEQKAINKEKQRTIYNWKPRYYGGQIYYDLLHKHLAIDDNIE